MKKNCSLLLLAIALLGINLFAQENKPAAITGYVKTATAKTPLVEAVITVSSDSFEGRKIALSGTDGNYIIKNLPSGTYTVTSEMEGFETQKQTNLRLTPGTSLQVNFEMAKKNKRTNGEARLRDDDASIDEHGKRKSPGKAARKYSIK